MGAERTFLNFAYGSNMLTRRIQERVPSARRIATATLAGYELRWHKVNRDGSGKCDIVRVQTPQAKVLGVVYEILSAQKPALDAAEGLDNGYDETQLVVQAAGGEMQVQTYFATKIDPASVPYRWYKALVVAGAKEHGLPSAYIGTLEAVMAVADADAPRAAKNFAMAKAG